MAFSYEVAAFTRSGTERKHPYTTDEPLVPGSVLRLAGRDWLAELVEDERVVAKPARYRIRLRHVDGHEELGAFRRWRSDAPRLGHTFTTLEDGVPILWEIKDDRLAYDDQNEPYLDLVAERNYAEVEELPDHELEHALANRDELPAGAEATLARAGDAGLFVELVALEAGDTPDWDEAQAYIDALELEVLEDDLIEMCGVNPGRDPQEMWVGKVKERLRSDLQRFRADVEGDHDEIEEWDFRDGRIFAAVGSFEDESDPDKGHGWMARLVDASALTAAGFHRVRKAELQV